LSNARSYRRYPAASACPTSLTLIAEIRNHDQEAWRRLVVLYTPLLRQWCHRWGVRGEDSEDVLQEVFQAVAIGLKNFRREREGDSFRGWLRGIARNKVLDLFRQHKFQSRGGTDFFRRSMQVPEPRPIPDADGGDPDEQFLLDDLYRNALELVRCEFEERTWQAFWRAAVEGQAPAVIAGDLGVTAATIRQSKSRVLRRLKDMLGEPPRPREIPAP
jgi:RNA polymerase sigma-70 factor (ECF subfamily)